MNISDAKWLCQLEEEKARLKRLVGEQALDIVVLKDVLSKNFLSPQSYGHGNKGGKLAGFSLTAVWHVTV